MTALLVNGMNVPLAISHYNKGMHMDPSFKFMGKLTEDPPFTSAEAYSRTKAHIMKTKELKAVVNNPKVNKDFIQPKQKDETFENKREFSPRRESYPLTDS